MKKANWFTRYLLPGFILKSVIVGGGYATGREFAEFFLTSGPWAALLGVLTATVVLSLVYAATLEFARLYGTFEYRGFFKRLLGPGWVAFEGLYLLMLLLVLAVISATVDSLLAGAVSAPAGLGATLFFFAVITLAFFGTAMIERYLVIWSFVLYAFYIGFVALCLARFGGDALHTLASTRLEDPLGASFNGLRYTGYNLAGITATLFCVRHLPTRRDALIGGLLGGPLAMLPGALFVFASLSFYPGIVVAPIPMEVLLDHLDVPLFRGLFLVVLLTALIGAGSAMVHSVNERISATRWIALGSLSRRQRGFIALLLLTLSTLVGARTGLVALVARGYGVITYGFILLFMLPVLTYGVWQIIRYRAEPSSTPAS